MVLGPARARKTVQVVQRPTPFRVSFGNTDAVHDRQLYTSKPYSRAVRGPDQSGETLSAETPEGLRFLNDGAATDGVCTFALVTAESTAELKQAQAPFELHVAMERVAVEPLSDWR